MNAARNSAGLDVPWTPACADASPMARGRQLQHPGVVVAPLPHRALNPAARLVLGKAPHTKPHHVVHVALGNAHGFPDYEVSAEPSGGAVGLRYPAGGPLPSIAWVPGGARQRAMARRGSKALHRAEARFSRLTGRVTLTSFKMDSFSGGGLSLSEGSARLLPASENVSPLRNTAVWCR